MARHLQLFDLTISLIRRAKPWGVDPIPKLARFLRRQDYAGSISRRGVVRSGPTSSEDKMLFPISMLLASQLVIAIADDVPKFDIERGCKIDSASAFDPKAGMSGTIKRCADDEQKAKDQLQAHWSEFVDGDRIACTGLTTSDAATPPSYVELQTCLQDRQFARRMPKE